MRGQTYILLALGGRSIPEDSREALEQRRPLRDADDIRARFLDALEDIRARYVLSYAPRHANAPGWHTLEVRLRGAKGEVLARPGYWGKAVDP